VKNWLDSQKVKRSRSELELLAGEEDDVAGDDESGCELMLSQIPSTRRPLYTQLSLAIDNVGFPHRNHGTPSYLEVHDVISGGLLSSAMTVNIQGCPA
jgi:hypothetical protein